MSDVLIELDSASPDETASSPSYFWNLRERDAGACIFQYTLSGSGAFRRKGETRLCGPGQAMAMAGGDAAEYFYPPQAEEPWRFAWLNFRGVGEYWRCVINRHGDLLDLDPGGEAAGLLLKTARLYKAKEFVDRFESSEWVCRMLAALGRELSLGSSHRPPVVRQARDYLRDHHRRPVNVKEVAARFGLSREHFSRLFHKDYGQSPAAWLRDLRLQTARHLLRTGAMPVQEVAEQSGFSSSTHFCRAFKQSLGMTPEGFRGRGRQQSLRHR